MIYVSESQARDFDAFLEATEARLERTERAVVAAIADGLYGRDAEGRVRDLRRSILGDETSPDDRLHGLNAVLEHDSAGWTASRSPCRRDGDVQPL